MMTYSQVRDMARRGNVIPLAKRVPSDLETPVSAFMKLAAGKKYSFLLESIEGGEKLARYSFIGFDPFLVVRGEAERVTVIKEGRQREIEAPPVEFLKQLFDVYKPVKLADLPRFTGGGVGYFAYDTIRWVERLPDDNEDAIRLPEMLLGLYSTILAFDHLRQEIVIIANILHDHSQPGLQRKYREAKARINEIVARLDRPLKIPSSSRRRSSTRVDELTSRSVYEKAVRRAKKYIKEGDIFQVVLSRRWQVTSKDSPLEVYRRLRRINPSPYMFLLSFGDDAIVGSSPEMMVRIEGKKIETRPIAGTRPRGKDDEEDVLLIADLLSDPKELAEHTMLVDLGRNDIGRVSKPGSVSVDAQMIIEKYSHVIHIVSSVTGELQRGSNALDGLFSCAPAGTVSGAPKIRAMEIIDELEERRRGVYAGTIAYLDFWGNLDSCIAIRTIVKKGGKYFVQAGAGIVADSQPRKESLETEAKAKALIEAVLGGSK